MLAAIARDDARLAALGAALASDSVDQRNHEQEAEKPERSTDSRPQPQPPATKGVAPAVAIREPAKDECRERDQRPLKDQIAPFGMQGDSYRWSDEGRVDGPSEDRLSVDEVMLHNLLWHLERPERPPRRRIPIWATPRRGWSVCGSENRAATAPVVSSSTTSRGTPPTFAAGG